MAGTVASPVLTGKVTFVDSNFEYVPDDAAAAAAAGSDVQLTEDDVRRLEEMFGFVEPPVTNPLPLLYDASDLDLGIGFERNNWVRQRVQPRLAVALQGDIRLRKPPHAEAELFGKIEPVPGRGYVEQFARSFDITGGDLLLNGRPKDHRVDLQAEYRSPSRDDSGSSDVIVRLEVKGPLDDLKLTLSSDPAMSEAEIVNYVATGRSQTANTGATRDEADTGALAAEIGLAGVTGSAQQKAQEAIGLDVLQLRFDALEGATLVAGRYVDPRLYVGFLQPLQYKDQGSPTTSGALTRTRFEVEYAFQRWLVFNVKGESTELRSFLRARHAY